MKKLVFDIPHNLNRLAEELFDIFPEWRGRQRDDGSFFNPKAKVGRSLDGKLVVFVPDDADEQAVRDLIDSHDPSEPSRNQIATQKRSEARSRARNEVEDNPNEPIRWGDLPDILRILRGSPDV